MASPQQQPPRTESLSTISPRNFSKPAVAPPPSPPPRPVAPVEPEMGRGSMSAESAALALARSPPLNLEKNHQWKPLGFLSVLRSVLVRTPVWLTRVRLLQLLLAGVVAGCLIWNLVVDGFSGYHATTVALLVAAVWTIFPTSLVTAPLSRGKHVLDPRVTLFADALACVLWGMTCAAHNAVQWNLETRTKFWATAEGPDATSSASLVSTSLSTPAPKPTTSSLSSTLPALTMAAIPTSVIAGHFSEERSPMQHHTFSLDARGLRLDANGLISNHDATVAWKLGLVASYFGTAEFVLFSFTTIVFAYYYHSALVADTATHTMPECPFSDNAVPASAVHKETAGTDLEANVHSETATKENSLVGKIASTLGTVVSPLRRQEHGNDSGIFGIIESTGIEVKQGEGEVAKVEGTTVFPRHGVVDGWAR